MPVRSPISNGLRTLRDLWCGTHSTSPESSEDRSESGAALVEFTVLMPVFFLILFGMVEFGSMIWVQNNMTNAAREGARSASVQGVTLAVASQNACKWLTGGQTFTIVVTDKCTTDQDVNVSVTVNKSSASLFNTFFFVNNQGSLTSGDWTGTMGANVTMRKEFVCAGTQAPATCQCNTAVSPPTCS